MPGEQLVVALHAMSERARTEGGRAAAAAMGAAGEREIKQRLSLSSHPPGTPTPSPPGSPPSLVSGGLRRSVFEDGPREEGAGRWVTVVRPTAAQARIQELGGVSGRGHRTRLPARPYVRPSVRDLVYSGRLQRVAEGAFAQAVFR